MLLLLPPGVERRTGNTKTVTDTGNAVGSAGARRDRGSHYRDLRRAKGPTCPTRARNTSFSIVSSPIRFIAAASSSLPASPSRSRNDPSTPDSARSRQRSSRYDGTPSSRDRLSVDSPRSKRSTTSRLRPTLQRCPGASPPGGTACPMESVDGLRPPSLPTGPTKTAEVSSKVSFMRAIPSRFHWTMWCPKKPGPAHLQRICAAQYCGIAYRWRGKTPIKNDKQEADQFPPGNRYGIIAKTGVPPDASAGDDAAADASHQVAAALQSRFGRLCRG